MPAYIKPTFLVHLLLYMLTGPGNTVGAAPGSSRDNNSRSSPLSGAASIGADGSVKLYLYLLRVRGAPTTVSVMPAGTEMQQPMPAVLSELVGGPERAGTVPSRSSSSSMQGQNMSAGVLLFKPLPAGLAMAAANDGDTMEIPLYPEGARARRLVRRLADMACRSVTASVKGWQVHSAFSERDKPTHGSWQGKSNDS